MVREERRVQGRADRAGLDRCGQRGASSWGASSLYTWIKLPTCPEFERVARATTLPIALLGGEAVGDARPVLEDLRRGMTAGANVRGAMIGRNVLYPGADDPRAVAAAVASIVHEGGGVDEALQAMDAERGKEPGAHMRSISAITAASCREPQEFQGRTR